MAPTRGRALVAVLLCVVTLTACQPRAGRAVAQAPERPAQWGVPAPEEELPPPPVPLPLPGAAPPVAHDLVAAGTPATAEPEPPPAQDAGVVLTGTQRLELRSASCTSPLEQHPLPGIEAPGIVELHTADRETRAWLTLAEDHTVTGAVFTLNGDFSGEFVHVEGPPAGGAGRLEVDGSGFSVRVSFAGLTLRVPGLWEFVLDGTLPCLLGEPGPEDGVTVTVTQRARFTGAACTPPVGPGPLAHVVWLSGDDGTAELAVTRDQQVTGRWLWVPPLLSDVVGDGPGGQVDGGVVTLPGVHLSTPQGPAYTLDGSLTCTEPADTGVVLSRPGGDQLLTSAACRVDPDGQLHEVRLGTAFVGDPEGGPVVLDLAIWPDRVSGRIEAPQSSVFVDETTVAPTPVRGDVDLVPSPPVELPSASSTLRWSAERYQVELSRRAERVTFHALTFEASDGARFVFDGTLPCYPLEL